jgi:hypothetical protein
MATLTRTVMYSIMESIHVTVEGRAVTPDCVTRFSPGSRVEIRKVHGRQYAVQALEIDSLRIFSEETWHAAV